MQASFACTMGAGGASLTPSLSFRNVVAHDSPAFAIMSNFKSGNLDCRRVDKEFQDLRQLFQERRASPYDVNVDGNTLLHVSIIVRFLKVSHYNIVREANILDLGSLPKSEPPLCKDCESVRHESRKSPFD